MSNIGLVSLMRARYVRATGQLMFRRRRVDTRVVISIGSRVADDRGATFSVIGHTGPTSLDGTPRATWQMDPGADALFVLACADTPGSGGNAAPGTITRFVTPLPGVDEVTNLEAFEGGGIFMEVLGNA